MILLKMILLKILFLHIALISSRPKIAIVGVHDEFYNKIGKYAFINKTIYAEKHGYDIFNYLGTLNKFKNIHWSKLIAIKKHLKDYDWIFWSDSDALITNLEIKLENLIDDNYNLIITRDCLGNINSGNFLIRNSSWSKKFILDWLLPKQEDFIIGLNDNGVLINLIKKSDEIKKNVKILPPKCMNSYLKCPIQYLIDGEFEHGDFILHFVGSDYETREKNMQKYFSIVHPVYDMSKIN
jgi:hypothetical protein